MSAHQPAPPPIPPGRGVACALVALVVLGTAACDGGLTLRNAVPAIGALGPVDASWMPGRTALVWIAVVDRDEDPVDVQLEVRLAGQDAFVPIVQAPGPGHGLVGLTTDPDFPGRLHPVLWDVSALDPAATVQLRAAADDRVAGAGTPVTTPAFVLSAGLPQAALPAPTAASTDTAGIDATGALPDAAGAAQSPRR